MKPDQPSSASFETTLTASGNNTGIVVPEGVIEQLGAGEASAGRGGRERI